MGCIEKRKGADHFRAFPAPIRDYTLRDCSEEAAGLSAQFFSSAHPGAVGFKGTHFFVSPLTSGHCVPFRLRSYSTARWLYDLGHPVWWKVLSTLCVLA